MLVRAKVAQLTAFNFSVAWGFVCGADLDKFALAKSGIPNMHSAKLLLP